MEKRLKENAHVAGQGIRSSFLFIASLLTTAATGVALVGSLYEAGRLLEEGAAVQVTVFMILAVGSALVTRESGKWMAREAKWFENYLYARKASTYLDLEDFEY